MACREMCERMGRDWGVNPDTYNIPYFSAHKTHRDFSLEILEKNNDEYILILVIYWKKTGLSHSQAVMPDLMIWKHISLSHDKDV